MWQIEPSTQWEKGLRYYEKKHPDELAAVLNNLNRYMSLLKTAPNSRSIQAGFLHGEPGGVVAIDQKGGGGNLQETRLYTVAVDSQQIVHLITIGNKADQPSDVSYSKAFAESLVNP